MRVIAISIILCINYIISYSELRIYKDNIKEKTYRLGCEAFGPGYRLHFTNKGYFVSIETIQQLNLTTIKNLFSSQLILLVETNDIPIDIMDYLTEFSAVFMQDKMMKNRNISSLPILGCEANIKTINQLIDSYDIRKMTGQIIGEIYFTAYFYSPNFVYKSTIALLIYTWVLILPKIYYYLCRINDPFQKVWFFSQGLCCVMSVLLFYLSICEIHYYNKYQLKPEKNMLYYLIIHLDSIFKAYSMTLFVAISNGVLFEYQLEIKQSGWYLILFKVLQALFGCDDTLNYFLKKNGSHLGYSFIQMALELKDLMLYLMLIKGILFNLQNLEITLTNDLPMHSSIHLRNYDIKICYIKKINKGLMVVLLFHSLLFLICKSGFAAFITGIIIPIMKMIGNMSLLTVINICFFPQSFTNQLWDNSKNYDNVYSATISNAIDLQYHYKDIWNESDQPYVIINPFAKSNKKLIFNHIKVGYIISQLRPRIKSDYQELENRE